VVDLESEIILAATVYHGTDNDAATLVQSVMNAQAQLDEAGIAIAIEEVAADKGYHANATLAACKELDLRTYIPERKSRYQRTWTKKPSQHKQAFYHNRQRMNRDKGRELQRLRSERVERSFAHLCETGGQRRTWLRGLEKINKRYLLSVAARNLGILMRTLFGIGTPRSLQGAKWAFAALFSTVKTLWQRLEMHSESYLAPLTNNFAIPTAAEINRASHFGRSSQPTNPAISTGC